MVVEMQEYQREARIVHNEKVHHAFDKLHLLLEIFSFQESLNFSVPSTNAIFKILQEIHDTLKDELF